MSNGSKHFGGKGSKQRPTDPGNPRAYQDNWEKIFGNKDKFKDKDDDKTKNKQQRGRYTSYMDW